ncbi:UDP-N-acetylmuramate dehydrogenase [Vreelandella neptunia]|uniref:UDP-N-acetylenolpyruvoylglucosamine reductase n=1 Tax=Vreelandella neptunia TaxID=115551 RepID=A0ABS9S781_9GAMM|nr:UDP-N-acetylmuramate dehydrogenase [Halomonas neptunia]MCH4811972.1 UDP-N-acetylmuramate dehydrogenase [Halomonas neptunia]
MGRLTQQALNELESLCPGGIERDVSLASISQWGIGGTADTVIRPSTSQQLADLRRWFYQHDVHHLTIGSTSNLLFADEGLRAPCIQLGNRLSHVSIDKNVVHAQAGVWVPSLARQLMLSGLTGGEHICGIPGTLGGLVCMNGGSQRKGIGSHVESIESVGVTGEVVHRAASDCRFAYRSSVYQTNNEVITSVKLKFDDGQAKQIRQEMLAILADRSRKFPRKLPNCGSVFKSNPAMYAEVGAPGTIIEKLGFKGYSIGDAFVSPMHANFIVHNGQGMAKDVLSLINEISEKVLLETGYKMEVEVIYVTPNGVFLPADQADSK